MEYQPIIVNNFSSFIRRERFMYSLMGMRLGTPVKVKVIIYFIVFSVIWSGPFMYFIFGLPSSFYSGAFLFGPPAGLAVLASKKIWGGRTMTAFLKILIEYMKEPAFWTGLNPFYEKGTEYIAGFSVWVSRRRELALLSRRKESAIKGRRR